MDPRAEAADLQENPLPVIIVPEDHSLPTAIWQVGLEIARLQEIIGRLQKDRQTMIDRALEINILEDDTCRLEQTVRKVRILDVSKFRAHFPKEFALICDMQRNEITRELEHVGEKIPITVADKFVPKKETTVCVDLKETVSWTVVKKTMGGTEGGA